MCWGERKKKKGKRFLSDIKEKVADQLTMDFLLFAGSVFGSKDRFQGLGVFFDTYSNNKANNHGHPYISALVNDGSIEYDHETDGTSQASGKGEKKERKKKSERASKRE